MGARRRIDANAAAPVTVRASHSNPRAPGRRGDGENADCPRVERTPFRLRIAVTLTVDSDGEPPDEHDPPAEAAATIPLWSHRPRLDPGARRLLSVVQALHAKHARERVALARSLKVRFPEDDQ